MTDQVPMQFAFFLGGHDLEMLTIRDFLVQQSVNVFDAQLRWGAKASQYENEITDALSVGQTAVLIELIDDTATQVSRHPRVTMIDHHGDHAGHDQPTSLEQVIRLFGLSNTDLQRNRHWQLVAANDRGHIRAMRSLQPSASNDEIRTIRVLDLQAQGIDERTLCAAKELTHIAERRLDGKLTILNVPDDRLGLYAEVMEEFFDGPGFENLLVIGKNEVGFYGNGRIIQRLAIQSPPNSSWYGGDLPDHGFWGATTSTLEFDPVAFISSVCSSPEP
jgi:hypothetical protein